MPTEEIKNMVSAYGWVDLGPQKNPYMISFRHDESHLRMNVYFTTMSVTIQHPDRHILSFRDVGVEQLEDIAEKYAV